MLRDFGDAKRPKNRVLRAFFKDKMILVQGYFGARVLVLVQGFFSDFFGARVFWCKGFKML